MVRGLPVTITRSAPQSRAQRSAADSRPCVPQQADRPWLGRPGLVVATVVLYVLAAVFFYYELDPELGATPAEMIATAVVVLALAVAAFGIPRRPARSPGRVPPWWQVGGAGVVLLGATQMIPGTWSWAGVALTTVALALLGALLLVWSGHTSWDRTHVLAVAGAALLVRGGLSFAVEPLGDVIYPVKYAVNTAILVGVIGLLVLAAHRLRRWEQPNQPRPSRNERSAGSRQR